ncbi:MAG TPA: VWA domain-containing protein [Vicinamibacterales bacterium]|nr:VWA domain-containing protein [Vicinamibacterales bacterium]
MRLVLSTLLIVALGSFESRPFASEGPLAQDGAAASQPAPPQPQTPVFRAGAELVRVDVTATTNGDEPVADLQISDFEVLEDDQPQTVETIKFIRVDGTRQANLDEPLQIRSKEHAILEAAREDVRLFAIFLDDYHIDKRPDITIPLRDTLTRFIKQLGPNDLVAIMEPLTTLYDLKYTRAKDELINRVRNFEGRRGEVFPVKSAIEEAQLTQRNWPELRAGVTLSALEALATQMGGLREGRKSILFFSQGPPLPPSSPNEQRYREAMEAANRGNVTIHVIDPRPLGSVGFGGANVLRRIAADTGGRAIVNTNDPTEQLEGVMADASAYYLLGYTPTRKGNDGKFHEIKVRVKRKGVRVTARRGYWAPSEKELTAAAEAAAMPVNTALTGALSALSDSTNTRSVSVWTGFSRGADAQTRVTFSWEANAGTTDKPARMEIQPLDDAGNVTMPAQVIGGAPGELPLAGEFLMRPGRHRIRFTVMTSAGDVIDRWVVSRIVPDSTKHSVVLSTPRFLRARNMIEFRAIEANPAASPTASTRFGPSDRVLVELEAQGADGQPPDIKVELLNAKGDLLRALDVPAVVNGKVRMPLPVNALANSTYVLKVEATAGSESAQQWVAFRVAR